MQQATSWSRSTRRAFQALVWAAAMMLVACDNDLTFSPTAPTFPNFAPVGTGRSVEISGSLTAAEGSCLEATVLFDGAEVAGARARCPNSRGCAEMDLDAITHTSPGHHTISFRVLRQSSEAVSYSAAGRIQVSRDGLSMSSTIPLEPRRATLRTGDGVTYDVEIWN